MHHMTIECPNLTLPYQAFVSIFAALGEVPEWLKGPAWKAGIGATLSGVRIPLSPHQKSSALRCFLVLERKGNDPNYTMCYKSISCKKVFGQATPPAMMYFITSADDASSGSTYSLGTMNS